MLKNRLNTKDYLRLKYSNLVFLTAEVLEVSEQIRSLKIVPNDELNYALCKPLFLTNPNFSQFGIAPLISKMLAAEFRKKCKNPLDPSSGEVKKIWAQNHLLRKYADLIISGNTWKVIFKSKIKKLKTSDWQKKEWIARFEYNGYIYPFHLPKSYFLAFSHLMSMLDGSLKTNELAKQFKHKFPKQLSIFKKFLKFAQELGILEVTSKPRPSIQNQPSMQFISHSSVSFSTTKASVLMDPCLIKIQREVNEKISYKAIDKSLQMLQSQTAIFVSHHHWDHCDISTVSRIRRDIPIYVPKVKLESRSNPSVKNFFVTLGFKKVFEVEDWNEIIINDIKVKCLPFYGEWFGPQSQFDAFVYLVECNGKTFLGTTDSDKDETGNMKTIFEIIKNEKYKIDYLLFCSSAQKHDNLIFSANPLQFENNLDKKYHKMRQYHPDTQQVYQWCKILKPKFIIPYAEFIFQNPNIRPPLVINENFSFYAHFKTYWESQKSILNKELIDWKKSLAGLQGQVKKKGCHLLMMGPGETLLLDTNT